MNSPKQPTHTTQTTEVKLPKWVENASQENYEFAKDVADKPYVAYKGDTVADPSRTTLDAYKYFKNTMNAGASDLSTASGIFNKTKNMSLDANNLFTKAAGGINSLNRDDYMNPFIDEVENKALGALDKQRIKSLMENADAAHAAKAFGGSRHGVVEAVTNAEAADAAGLLSANLRKDAFDTSSNLMQQDINNMFSGGQGILSSAESLGASGRDFMSLADAKQEDRGKNFAGLLGIGQAEQTQKQAELDDAYARWREMQDEDVNDLNIRLSALGMSPYGKSETTDKVTTGGSSGGADWASAGVGALSLLFGLFSDKRDKTDIEKLGKDPDTGLDIYAYRYKKDPKSYPKVVGPMAQDVEDMFPSLVREVGGHKMIGAMR